jgi:hypothetical protein
MTSQRVFFFVFAVEMKFLCCAWATLSINTLNAGKQNQW